MEVLNHTDDHQPTCMRDVYEALIGKEVTVRISNSHYAHGKLEAYNGSILKVVEEKGATYIPVINVAAISEVY